MSELLGEVHLLLATMKDRPSSSTFFWKKLSSKPMWSQVHFLISTGSSTAGSTGGRGRCPVRVPSSHCEIGILCKRIVLVKKPIMSFSPEGRIKDRKRFLVKLIVGIRNVEDSQDV